MKYPVLIVVAALLSGSTIAQNVEVIQSSGDLPPSTDEFFSFIESTTDTTAITYIGRLKVSATGPQSSIANLYQALDKKAHAMGADAFKLREYRRDTTTNSSTLVLDIFFMNDSMRVFNFDSHVKNVIFVFGSEKRSDRSMSFRIDNEKKEVAGGTYYRHQNPQGKETKISKGGITGAAAWIRWKENKPSTFVTLSGFGLAGGNVPAGTVGFNTGRLNFINGDLGHLMIEIIDRKK
jgi:hypothetical protein